MSIPVSKLLLGVALSGLATGAAAETLIVAHDLPPTHYYSVRGFEAMMSCVTERTGGEIEFDYYPGGTIIHRDEGITAIQEGLAHITFVTIGEETARMPMQGVTMLPGIANSATELADGWRKAVADGGVLAQEWADMGVRPIGITALAPYQIVSGRGAIIDSPEAFAGKKVRTTGSALNFLVEALGGVAVQMPGPEIYTAMQRGTVDGTLFSFSSVKPYSVQEVMGAMSSNGSFGTAAQAIGMSQEVFDGLTPDQQTAMDECALKAVTDLTKWIDEGEAAIAKEFVDSGVNVFEFTDEQIATFDEGMASVADDFVARLKSRDIPADVALAELKAAMGR
ncbi:TRAP transporter substrate-binding protein DctP [Salipiger sp.]|uniref:TRAP transporter substrate-binding protein n=1 Tax=Salipiger sp. TaxID=2078585 RepID=UPI003A97DC30